MWKVLVSMWKFYLGLFFGCCCVGLAIVAFGYTLSYANMDHTVDAVYAGVSTIGFFVLALVIVFKACQTEDEEIPPARREREQITPEEFISLGRRDRWLRGSP